MDTPKTEHAPQASTVQHRPEERPWLPPLGIVAYIVALSSFVGIASLPFLETVIHNEQHDIVRITVPNPSVRSAMAVCGIVGALALLVTGIVCILCRRILFGAIAIVIALSGYCGANIASFIVNLSPWTTQAEILAPDGHTYYLMDSSFWQGQLLAIARRKSNTILTRTMEVQGVTNGDSPRSWASVIRPAGAPKDDYGQLYVTDANMIIGIRYNYKCYLAYDTTSSRFYGFEDIEQLSPFVLIGPNTPMCQSDIEGVIGEVERWIRHLSNEPDIRMLAGYLSGNRPPGYPHDETLQAGLKHANSGVREVSRRILEIHEKGVERVREQVSTTH